MDFCHKRKIDPYNCKSDNGIEFLSYLFQNGEKYGYIAAARSALSAVLQKEEDTTIQIQLLERIPGWQSFLKEFFD